MRVWTAAICVRKISMPSRKKGRFSSKKMGKRWLAVTTVASASTCAKSGLTARSSVSADEATNFAVSPGSKTTGWLTKTPLSGTPSALAHAHLEALVVGEEPEKCGLAAA